MLRKLILALTFLAIPVFCSVLIPPDEYFIAGMMTLTIPFFTLILFGSFLYFADARSKWTFVPAGILCFAFPLFSSSFSFTTKKPVIDPALKVLSHNMNALEYYHHPEKFTSNSSDFKAWAAAENFDILCLQEMVEVQRDSFVIPGYHRASSVKNTKTGDNLGLFIFSRYPIIAEGKLEFAFNSFNRLMWTDILVGHDTVRIVNVHLMSYDFLPRSIATNIGKVKAGLRARSWHAKLIDRFLAETRHAVILCGDLNETPVSYPYRKINSRLNDTYAGSGKIFQSSYRFAGLPIRIDHVFISPALRSVDYNIGTSVSWSDHSPVSVRIGWPKQD